MIEGKEEKIGGKRALLKIKSVTLHSLKIKKSLMSLNLSLNKGLDLCLQGAAKQGEPRLVTVDRVAVVPDDFPGLTPKLAVAEGDKVEAGQPLLTDKWHPEIKIASPASGTVKEIVRGARRKLERVVVEVDPYAGKPAAKVPAQATADDIKAALLASGLWAMMRQRPYDVVPDVEAAPRDIFITGFDSAPLAPDLAQAVNGKEKELAKGVEVLQKLTAGKVYISRRDGETLKDVPGAEMVDVKGPHPSGNVGVLMANVKPVNKGETVWGLDIVTLERIGEYMLTGAVPMHTLVAITGSELSDPQLVTTLIGADVAPLLKGLVKDDGRHHRVIAGNVLTGVKIPEDGYLRFPYRQVTVIPEGDDVAEFMGWASLSPKAQSVSRSFLGHFFKRPAAPDARIMGGRRAMIMSGEYDKMIPMDIMAEYLIKAIIAKDIDRMEALGIYEVAPEDFAMAEYVDTSKLPLQQIVRDGLNYLKKELS